jgi:hypothetical protein
MHGNANAQLQELMVLRFAATRRICQELDSTERSTLPLHVRTLHNVLAFVKDPASIGWLERNLESDRAGEFYDFYLPHWHTFLWGAPHEDVKWVQGAEHWSAFFRRLYAREHDEQHRVEILEAMRAWLHDADTLTFFANMERSPEVTGHALLIAQAYLHQHGVPLNADRVNATIEQLRVEPETAKLLLEYADEIRHEAYIPWLISIVGPKTPKDQVGSAQWVLEEITFRRDVSGQDEWEAWYARFGSENRRVWADRVVREYLGLLEADPTQALAFLDRAMYRWKDILLLPHMDELLKHKVIHNELVGWINLTYRPHWRNELQAVARRILAESGDDLEGWAKGLLHGLDFLEGEEMTWEEHVHRDNMRM